MQSTLNSISDRLSEFEKTQLKKLLGEYEHIGTLELPTGLIHGDLFKDKALFNDRIELRGVIDFYYACHDMLLQHVAIAVHDWCRTSTGTIHEKSRATLIAGYKQVRFLEKEELRILNPLQRTSTAQSALTRFLSVDTPLKPAEEMLRLAKSLTV